ncbi:single-stranded DNA-binding protein [Peptacetobacter hominis]|uniref:Single-stranded DNA-binding protein n=1 Tax=Peptacetobacter hominis TaxID=2743610 RepID=A0A544QV36_9FIRM|nr:single-stranded DNA-binding protein [Peptacetobacter hominis]TQQ84563.1 single-stranded DNA-binding protein [Peptacetobacter hominis]
MNQVALVGRLTKDPELRYIPGTGTPVATFTLAVNRDFTKRDGTREADFIPIEVMGKAAEFCANYLSKGRLVACQGQIRVDNYQTQSGEWKNFTKVSCRQVDALESRKSVETSGMGGFDGGYSNNNFNNQNEPAFEPGGPSPDLDPNGFGAVDDDDIPF